MKVLQGIAAGKSGRQKPAGLPLSLFAIGAKLVRQREGGLSTTPPAKTAPGALPVRSNKSYAHRIDLDLLERAVAPSRNAAAEDWLNQRAVSESHGPPRLDRQALEWNDVTVPAKITQVNGDWLWVGNAWVSRATSSKRPTA